MFFQKTLVERERGVLQLAISAMFFFFGNQRK
jgi:hypothetical protein